MYALEYQQLKSVLHFERLSSSLLRPLKMVNCTQMVADDTEEGLYLSVLFQLRHIQSLGLSCLVIAAQFGLLSWVCWHPVYDQSSSLFHTWSLSLWHCVYLSSALRHSQWDANTWNEDASMMDVLLRFGRQKTVLVISRSCSAHFLRSRRPLLLHFPISSDSITPSQVCWSVTTLSVSLSVRGFAEKTLSRSS